MTSSPGTRRDDGRGGDGRGVDAVQVVDGTLVRVMAWWGDEWGCAPADDPPGRQRV
jgi:hypothetical protein